MPLPITFQKNFMKLRNTLLSIIFATFASVVVGCGAKGNVSPDVKDRKAYSLGREHARRVIAVSDDEAALQDPLLDVRARITNINDRLGPQASADYERGFVDCITEEEDSLAKVLF